MDNIEALNWGSQGTRSLFMQTIFIQTGGPHCLHRLEDIEDDNIHNLMLKTHQKFYFSRYLLYKVERFQLQAINSSMISLSSSYNLRSIDSNIAL